MVDVLEYESLREPVVILELPVNTWPASDTTGHNLICYQTGVPPPTTIVPPFANAKIKLPFIQHCQYNNKCFIDFYGDKKWV